VACLSPSSGPSAVTRFFLTRESSCTFPFSFPPVYSYLLRTFGLCYHIEYLTFRPELLAPSSSVLRLRSSFLHRSRISGPLVPSKPVALVSLVTSLRRRLSLSVFCLHFSGACHLSPSVCSFFLYLLVSSRDSLSPVTKPEPAVDSSSLPPRPPPGPLFLPRFSTSLSFRDDHADLFRRPSLIPSGSPPFTFQ